MERKLLLLFIKIKPKAKPALPYPVPALQIPLGTGEGLSSPPFSLSLTVPLSFYVQLCLCSPESGNATSLPTRSTERPAMTTSCVSAMPWSTDTMLPTTATSGSAEEPNKSAKKPSFYGGVSFYIPCSSITEVYRCGCAACSFT